MNRPGETLDLPPITDQYLESTFGRATPPPISGAGGKDLELAVQYWNSQNYERSFPLLKSAVERGLCSAHKSLAHSLLGQIELERHNLLLAVGHFIACLSIEGRDRGMFWEAATRLEMIYRGAGRLSEAAKLAAGAKRANPEGSLTNLLWSIIFVSWSQRRWRKRQVATKGMAF